MKVTNWRRKLAASLVAGGLMAPTALHAQSLDTNLVTNPSFENVGPVCPPSPFCYSASEILDWTDGTLTGFAYSYGQSYDVGGPLAGGGTYYFTPNTIGSVIDDIVTAPGQVSQNINVNVNATPVKAQIASGEAAVKLSAYFTSYTTDEDIGNLHVEFLNSGGGSLGSTVISAKSPITTWQQRRGVSLAPKGTTTLKVSVYGTAVSSGPDGYTDLVDVRVVPAADELLFVEVNTTNGQMTLKNQTGDPIHIDYYEITAQPKNDFNGNGKVDGPDYVLWRNGGPLKNESDTPATVNAADYTAWRSSFKLPANQLNATAWNSLQEQNLAGFPAGNGTGNGWEQAGGSNGGVLSESYLTGNSTVANSASINLGAGFNVGTLQNLEFRYGVVEDEGSGFIGAGTLVQGFVRYVTSGLGSGDNVPEPSSILLVGIGLASLAVGGRTSHRKNNS